MTTTTRTTWRLAQMAGCADPDQPDAYGWKTPPVPPIDPLEGSPGAYFLRAVETSTLERLDYLEPYEDIHDVVHQVADAAPNDYTYDRWQEFVDLAAWTEDEEARELYGRNADMTERAAVCLYLIAARLAAAIIEEERPDQDNADDQEHDA